MPTNAPISDAFWDVGSWDANDVVSTPGSELLSIAPRTGLGVPFVKNAANNSALYLADFRAGDGRPSFGFDAAAGRHMIADSLASLWSGTDTGKPLGFACEAIVEDSAIDKNFFSVARVGGGGGHRTKINGNGNDLQSGSHTNATGGSGGNAIQTVVNLFGYHDTYYYRFSGAELDIDTGTGLNASSATAEGSSTLDRFTLAAWRRTTLIDGFFHGRIRWFGFTTNVITDAYRDEIDRWIRRRGESGKIYQISWVGDSITQNNEGYRKQQWLRMGGEYPVDVVGKQNGGPWPHAKHDAYPGRPLAELKVHIEEDYGITVFPDIVIINSGTTEASRPDGSPYDGPAIAATYREILDLIHERLPNARILATNIVPTRVWEANRLDYRARQQQNWVEFEADFPGVLAYGYDACACVGNIWTGSYILYDGVPGDFFDGIHPDPLTGHVKITDDPTYGVVQALVALMAELDAVDATITDVCAEITDSAECVVSNAQIGTITDVCAEITDSATASQFVVTTKKINLTVPVGDSRSMTASAESRSFIAPPATRTVIV